MKIRDLLASKGSDVVTIVPEGTLADVVTRLHARSIGALVVSSGGKRVEGIVSERDVVRALADGGASALERRVADVMSTPVTTCAPDDEVTALMALMTERRIRHLPVVEAARLVGIVSIGDVVKSRVDQLERDRKELLEYVSAR